MYTRDLHDDGESVVVVRGARADEEGALGSIAQQLLRLVARAVLEPRALILVHHQRLVLADHVTRLVRTARVRDAVHQHAVAVAAFFLL